MVNRHAEDNMADKPKISKHEKRLAAFKMLFAREFNMNDDPVGIYNALLYDYLSEDGELVINKEYSSEYVKNTFFGIIEKLDEIDTEIETTSIKWKLSRMSIPTRTVLRLAVYELLWTDTPPKAVISEAIDIVRDYDDEAAPAFVNGILNKIARSHGIIAEPQNLSVNKPDETI